MAFDVLEKARAPLHVAQLPARIQSCFGVTTDRESLVSSLSRKVARKAHRPSRLDQVILGHK